jgi:hypothetical protein
LQHKVLLWRMALVGSYPTTAEERIDAIEDHRRILEAMSRADPPKAGRTAHPPTSTGGAPSSWPRSRIAVKPESGIDARSAADITGLGRRIWALSQKKFCADGTRSCRMSEGSHAWS